MSRHSRGFSWGFFPGPSVNPDLDGIIARMPDPVSTDVENALNAFLNSMGAGGGGGNLWNGFDAIWFVAADTFDNGAINLKSASHTLTELNGPGTYDQFLGWSGNGVDQALETNYIPSTDGVQFAGANASLGIYLNGGTDAAATDATVMGGRGSNTNQRSFIGPWSVSNNVFGSINGGGNIDEGTDVATRFGTTSVTKTSSTLRQTWRNGVQTANALGTASTNRSTAQFYLGARNENGTWTEGTDNRIAAAWIGRAFDADEQAAIHAGIELYLAQIAP